MTLYDVKVAFLKEGDSYRNEFGKVEHKHQARMSHDQAQALIDELAITGLDLSYEEEVVRLTKNSEADLYELCGYEVIKLPDDHPDYVAHRWQDILNKIKPHEKQVLLLALIGLIKNVHLTPSNHELEVGEQMYELIFADLKRKTAS